MTPYEEAAFAALMKIERRRLPYLGWQAHSVDLMRQLRAQGRKMTESRRSSPSTGFAIRAAGSGPPGKLPLCSACAPTG